MLILSAIGYYSKEATISDRCAYRSTIHGRQLYGCSYEHYSEVAALSGNTVVVVSHYSREADISLILLLL